MNGASFARDERGAVVAPGGIFTIFGENLSSLVESAASTPLPTNMAGSSVLVGGVTAPLLYVSPKQINFQAPSSLPFPRNIQISVRTQQGVSDPFAASAVYSSVGLFSQNSSGCGQGAIQNVAPDGSVSPNSPAHSASPGNYISIYGTGIGQVYFPPPDGQPAGVDRLAVYGSNGLIGFGLQGSFVKTAGSQYIGRAPGLVGVDQVNVKIPDDVPEGCRVPLTVSGYGSDSQAVVVSIARGGACVNPPQVSYAGLSWKRTAVSGPQPSEASVVDEFSAAFSKAADNLVPQKRPEYESGGICTRMLPSISTSKCGDALPEGLDAGKLSLSWSGGSMLLGPESGGRSGTYSAVLPAGSIRPGPLRVSSTGGSSVGPFDTNIVLPAPMTITSDLRPGTVIPYQSQFSVSWTGGAPDWVVRTRLLSQDSTGVWFYCEMSVLASDGGAKFPLYEIMPGYPILLVSRTENAEVEITVSPRLAGMVSFAASGLTRSGTNAWSYVYRFRGLKIK